MTLRRGKTILCKVILLDDQVPEFTVNKKSYGEELYTQVTQHLQLLESDYFGLEYRKDDKEVWLDREKPIDYQIKNSQNVSFKFKVKFYTPDPNLLEDEFTRYLFALQVKQDLASGRLICNMNTTAMLSAYIAQGELGDYCEEEMPDHTYLKCISFVPSQTDELEQCILQYHRGVGLPGLKGITPADADFKLLDTARKTDYYGIVLHPAQDHEGVQLQLAVTDCGIFVFQNQQKINTFSWAMIRKLSFKRKRFLIKLHPAADQAYYKNIVEFFFDTRNQSKMFWKLSIEHHAFYRCRTVAPAKKHRRAVLTRGSSFRYTGRTQKQLLDHVRENYVKGSRSFERTLSTRHTLAGHRSFVTSRSETLNSKKEFQQETSTLSSGSHLLGGSESQHSGLKTPASPTRSSPMDRSVEIAPSPPIARPTPPLGIDRKQSEPVLGQGHDLSLNDSKLSRAPECANIPEQVEAPPELLPRMVVGTELPEETNLRVEGASSNTQAAEPQLVDPSPPCESLDSAPVVISVDIPSCTTVDKSGDPTAVCANQNVQTTFCNEVSSDIHVNLPANHSPVACVGFPSDTPAKVSLDTPAKVSLDTPAKVSPNIPASESSATPINVSPDISDDVSTDTAVHIPLATDVNKSPDSVVTEVRDTGVKVVMFCDTPVTVPFNSELQTNPSNLTELPPHSDDVVSSDNTAMEETPEHVSPPSVPPIHRIHSENDTTGHARIPYPHNNSVHEKQMEVKPVSPNHSQFSIGSNELLNGKHTPGKSDTLSDSRKMSKKPLTDRAYYIAKEFLMTERTYLKDLTIVMVHFREYMTSDTAAQSILAQLYDRLQPLYSAHSTFLELIEKRMSQCDSRISDSLTVEIGDLIRDHFNNIECYSTYLCGLEDILTELVKCSDTNLEFGTKLHEFETEKMCYLPIFTLVLKPAHRLFYYENVLNKLVEYYSVGSVEYDNCRQASLSVTTLLNSLRAIIAELENTEKLIELQEDISGVQELVHQGRYFIREGCLQKLSRRGYQQRLFLLLSDVLLYTSRAQSSSQLQFKVHGFMPMTGMTLEESDPNVGVSNGFTIYAANRCLIVAANSQEEKDKWIEDLNFAIGLANSDQVEFLEIPLPSINPPNSSNQDGDDPETPTSPDKPPQIQHRANTTMHVCWHRNTSVSIKDIQNAIKHQLSGYLLRKFKNSNGWQKLWVVFTNFCLFFYKTYQDDHPLASLPLLGYSVSKPSASDGINKDYVFKLQFKNHIYFFRAESEYTFDRWMEVINSATHSARRTRMFSRVDSLT
ncbi:FARP1 [Bugula neritina]|uniref:FARP1 n=1 Tax=Bugula neritina TaxID=10212 RepID=A0A7J7JDW2_BUGNE|nr:FARP1 [Bugula neritina]